MSKHKAKIEKVFEHPLSSNIDYKKLIHALEHYGAKIEMTKNHHVKIFLNDKEYVMPLPHQDTNISKEIVVELRHFLESAGLTPEKL
ncbi:hypothetical protein [Sulfurimonas hydrogeniphila]|uniref:hypothetical protein n=1 Tax=Sulfurimonas hydrogeniphila TaxID=2509341 RepID=UPI00125F2E99|nr:hypothetical protein [Sulfurimonas hydrogeniphila]